MTSTDWLLSAGLCLLMISLFALAIALYAVHRAINAEIEVKALRSSTHSVQFVPADESLGRDPEEDELVKASNKSEEAQWKDLRENAIESLS